MLNVSWSLLRGATRPSRRSAFSIQDKEFLTAVVMALDSRVPVTHFKPIDDAATHAIVSDWPPRRTHIDTLSKVGFTSK